MSAIIWLFLLGFMHMIFTVKMESFPYHPAKIGDECHRDTLPPLECNKRCWSLGYNWGTCVGLLEGKCWHFKCSCFTKPIQELEIDDDPYIDMPKNPHPKKLNPEEYICN
uniref:Venom protein n=1 Tax=Hadrurus spadix TaxID=141984 RepID=A0A1W7R937_9SCOR